MFGYRLQRTKTLAWAATHVGEEEVGGDGEARAVQQAIPNTRLVTIPRAGHAVFAEQPDAGTAAVTEFIREAEAP
jgi:pimeloyl-ACP methyl ester carboxylesterase